MVSAVKQVAVERGASRAEFDRANEYMGGSVAGNDARPEAVPPVKPRAGAEAEAAFRVDANAAMERHAAGEPAAFRELYKLVSDRLYRYLLRRSGDPARAEDLMQQTLLHMHRARASYEANRGVLPWMYCIAGRLAIDAHRRSGHEVRRDEDGDASDSICADGAADELLIGRQLEARIGAILDRLPEHQRTAFELVRLEGLTYAEAAESMGITCSSLTARLHRADRAIHDALAREDR